MSKPVAAGRSHVHVRVNISFTMVSTVEEGAQIEQRRTARLSGVHNQEEHSQLFECRSIPYASFEVLHATLRHRIGEALDEVLGSHERPFPPGPAAPSEG